MKRLILTLLATALVGASLAQSVSEDKKIGAENALLVEQEMGLYEHDSLYQLINAVGKKLVARLRENPFEFKFFLVDSEEPNAFALPGGYIYVTRGILPFIQTEDELAGIMAHEIIHVTERHSIKQLRRDKVGAVLQIPGKVINSVTRTGLGNIINVPLALSSKAFISKYSRGHEKDADGYGIQLAASAGYNPSALADALDRLEKGIEILTGAQEKHDYFSDHPLTSTRLVDIRKGSPNYKPGSESHISETQEKFQGNFNGLCFGPNPKQGVFVKNIFTHPDLGFSWTVPEGWKTVNKPVGVGTYTEKGDAALVLSIADSINDVTKAGESARDKVAKSSGTVIQSAGDTVINSNKAYILRLKNKNESNNLMEFLWIKLNDNVYQLGGVFVVQNKNVAHNALCSFRKASDEELNAVTQFELRLVRSKENETIDQLSERTSNKLIPSMTSLINGIGQKDPLKKDRLVKIVRSFSYRPK